MTPGRGLYLIEGPVQLDWTDRAACAGADPDVFFPGKGNDAAGAAKRICAGCPVRVECLDYAIERPERVGVWGGKTPNERKAIRRQRRRGVA